ncbi:MAG: hypothetical protein ACQGQO_04660 [Sphaerochaetaceae bacterium]
MEQINLSEIFWKNVDRLVDDKNLTIVDFCKYSGINYRSLSNQRYRNQVPKLEQIIGMAKYFGVSIDFLVGVSNKSDYSRFLPYLDKADDATIKSVKKLLDMPNPEAEKKADA